MDTINAYLKSITATWVAFYGAYQVAAADGTVATDEWFQIVAAVLTTASAVWAVTNTPKDTPLPFKEPPPF